MSFDILAISTSETRLSWCLLEAQGDITVGCVRLYKVKRTGWFGEVAQATRDILRGKPVTVRVVVDLIPDATARIARVSNACYETVKELVPYHHQAEVDLPPDPDDEDAVGYGPACAIQLAYYESVRLDTMVP